MEGTNKDGEIPKSQEPWGGGVISVPKGARAGIRCQNKKRAAVRKVYPAGVVDFSCGMQPIRGDPVEMEPGR